MTRRLVILFAVGALIAVIATAATSSPGEPRYRGRTFEGWRLLVLDRTEQRNHLQHRLTRRVLELRAVRRHLLRRPSSLEALRLASIAYDVPFSTLYRRASCESTGSQPAYPPSEHTLYAYAKNPSSTASGLLQFLISTWASTPYAAESVWSPYANALAAGWMMSHGRGGEWVCR